jgi:signal transduction histidine kinase
VTAKTIRLFLILIFFSIPIIANGIALAEGTKTEPKRILILHSYHAGLPWTDQIMSGMQSVFDNTNVHLTVDVEYLDTKRHHDSRYFSNILDAILHYKFKDSKYDLVLLSDNEALNFALEHRNSVLHSTPIVYCGINCDSQELAQGVPDITGVRADPDYAGVIQQALAFHPKVSKIVVIGSTMDLSDRVNHQKLLGMSRRLSGKPEFFFWNDVPAEILRKQLSDLGDDSLVVINGSIRDQHDNLLSFKEENLLIRQATKLPIYSFWDVYLDQGIVGGSLLNARHQGVQAAEIALQIIQRHSAGSIPVVKSTFDSPVFDFNELVRLGIPLNHLPAKHRLVNAPSASYEITKSQFWVSAGLLCCSLVVTLILSRNNILRRRAEAHLRQSEQSYKNLSQQFQVILHGIPNGLALISKDMKVVWSNNHEGDYFNKNIESIPGEYCCKLLFSRPSFCDNCPVVKTLTSGTDEEAIITTTDGRSLEVKAFPIKSASGETTHAITLASDVTEKRRLIEENNRNGHLASLGELAAGVAHEINNPNALIMLNAELLRKACFDAAPILQHHYENHGEFLLTGFPYQEIRNELPHLFAEMFESACRIKRIVNDLKDFSRQDIPTDLEPVDLNDALSASIRLANSTIMNSTNKFSVSYAQPPPTFLGNLHRIEQVIVNLLLNACQSLPDKNSGVEISTLYDSDRQSCVIRVQDEGCGISEENLAHITDPFFTTKRESSGTGLGLSVSHRIIKDYSGTFEFKSEVNKGTTVSVYLPVNKEANAHD